MLALFTDSPISLSIAWHQGACRNDIAGENGCKGFKLRPNLFRASFESPVCYAYNKPSRVQLRKVTADG